MIATAVHEASPQVGVDRVERVPPRPREQPERRRRDGREFPDLEKDGHDRPANAPREHPPRRDGGAETDEEHLIDVLVRGRMLPTGQILPTSTGASLPD